MSTTGETHQFEDIFSLERSLWLLWCCAVQSFWETETILPFSKVKDDNLTFMMIQCAAIYFPTQEYKDEEVQIFSFW